MNTLKTAMCNPFDVDNVEDLFPLSNLAKGVVMPAELSQPLLNAEILGADKMKLFVCMRTNEVGFWETLPKINITTFASFSSQYMRSL